MRRAAVPAGDGAASVPAPRGGYVSACRHLLLIGLVIVSAAALILAVRHWLEVRALRSAIHRQLAWPIPAPPDLLHRWFDVTPISVTYTANWQKFSMVVPRYQFLTDHTIWARMHFEDWDRLAAEDRQPALAALLARSGGVIHAGDCWPTMTPEDWDDVPQPVRAVAMLGVVEYWTRFYDVGGMYEHPIKDMVETVQAVVMSESWFNHRGEFTNADGSRDLGLAGASGYARDVIRDWYVRGLVDFTLADADYFNPWPAARFAAFWFDLMVHEADGNIDLAIRAYNQGIARARLGHGDDYLAGVRRRRRQYMRGLSGSPTWNAVLAWRDLPGTEAPAPCHQATGG
jgi:hypothetical protein